ncbi:MAG TPA: hypothetical protein VGS97_20190 [Actinocrinis sp.]|uniref:hypothetical protein n=1 Tax=Actinocrinis sp. TaxID=1920516 RepID=UPI002DDDA2F2|nr:hypothetical protein [Actinocrinis sp.]HEV2346430.1 hypothetical protein [Actinocrinis sp.]
MTEQDSIEVYGDGDQPWTPAPAERYASVWPHTLGDHEHWKDAVAVLQANGALVVTQWGAPGAVPLKIYAPGAWISVDHVGDYTPHPVPSGAPSVRDRIVPSEEVAPELSGERTGEMPKYRDPVEQLDPDLLDAENGDVNHRSGVGVLVPRQPAPAPGFGTADPGEGGAAPKAVAAAEPTAEDPADTDVSVAQFVLGVSLDRPRRWLHARPWQRRPRSLDQMLGGTPTHLLSAVLPTSRAMWWLLAGLLPLLALVLTTR